MDAGSSGPIPAYTADGRDFLFQTHPHLPYVARCLWKAHGPLEEMRRQVYFDSRLSRWWVKCTACFPPLHPCSPRCERYLLFTANPRQLIRNGVSCIDWPARSHFHRGAYVYIVNYFEHINAFGQFVLDVVFFFSLHWMWFTPSCVRRAQTGGYICQQHPPRYYLYSARCRCAKGCRVRQPTKYSRDSLNILTLIDAQVTPKDNHFKQRPQHHVLKWPSVLGGWKFILTWDGVSFYNQCPRDRIDINQSENSGGNVILQDTSAPLLPFSLTVIKPHHVMHLGDWWCSICGCVFFCPSPVIPK